MSERRYQVMWFNTGWREWPWIKRYTFPDSDLRYIYRWVLWIGPLEIRRWETELKP